MNSQRQTGESRLSLWHTVKALRTNFHGLEPVRGMSRCGGLVGVYATPLDSPQAKSHYVNVAGVLTHSRDRNHAARFHDTIS